MAKGKFREQAVDMNFSLSMLQNRAIKKAMAAGVQAAGLATHHDSSNAAVHWVVVPDGRRVRSSWKVARDLRGLKGRGKARKGRRAPKVAVVGYRGDNRDSYPALVLKVVRHVVARERSKVLDKVVVGRLDPVRKFYFYNAIESGAFAAEKSDDYAENAKLYSAGDAAVAAALRAAEEAFVAGFARSKFKK